MRMVAEPLLSQSLYILVVDQVRARLYMAANASGKLVLVYHQARFGARPVSITDDDELARSLCRMLRTERKLGNYLQLVIVGCDGMLSALHRQYDGDWRNVIPADLARLPAQYSEGDLEAYVRHLLEQGTPPAVAASESGDKPAQREQLNVPAHHL
jgi:hypothetical protein